MNYQAATHLRCFMFALGAVFASSPEEADQFASEHGLWDRRPDGTWGREASQAHARLCEDQQAAYRRAAQREPVVTCRFCGAACTADDHGTLVDATGGDVCTEHGDDLPHEAGEAGR